MSFPHAIIKMVNDLKKGGMKPSQPHNYGQISHMHACMMFFYTYKLQLCHSEDNIDQIEVKEIIICTATPEYC